MFFVLKNRFLFISFCFLMVFSGNVFAQKNDSLSKYSYVDLHYRIMDAEKDTLRLHTYLKEYKPLEKSKHRLHLRYIRYNLHYLDAPFKTLVILGIKDKARLYYWKLVFWSLFRRPRLLPMAITYMVYGFHFRKVFRTMH